NFDSGLVNIHFFIPAGSKLAIIGRQGSGKSTLIKLMTGQIKPDSGLLTIGGIRMEDIGTEQFLDITGICTNNSELLEGTVEWNITLEKETKNNKRLKDVIDATMLNNFIINVEDGIKLFVEPSRNNISDSIRRKILLARLLYQNKPLIFIDLEDQFTDPIENLTLFESVMDYCHDKTVVYTTKNTDVAGLASQIVLLENGEQLMVKTGAEYLKMNERNELTTTDQENRH
ncbi:MAG TPA: ATP-binding cassette domain-containing protein, partial [Saprospiraceae bacterium]|nr:ATP-binding cassette domain-containing protein [Saprospiraceae bacterium]